MKEAAEEVPKELKEEVEDSDVPFGKLGKGCDVDIAVCSLKSSFDLENVKKLPCTQSKA